MADYFKDKVAVVTGAGSGIGASIARLLAEKGARVHCADLDGGAAGEVASGLDRGMAHACDVTDAQAVQALADTVFAADGRVDFLFNNAGIATAGRIGDTTLADWRKVIDVNVMGVVNGLHAFLPRMREQGSGHIANTASAAGLVAVPRLGAYCATKHAVVGLSQSLASEVRDEGLYVTILCPGIINTPIVKRAVARGDAEQGVAHAADYYARKGASPDKVAADLLSDMRRKKLFCVTPRAEVGAAWLSQRLSPRLAALITGPGSRALMKIKK